MSLTYQNLTALYKKQETEFRKKNILQEELTFNGWHEWEYTDRDLEILKKLNDFLLDIYTRYLGYTDINVTKEMLDYGVLALTHIDNKTNIHQMIDLIKKGNQFYKMLERYHRFVIFKTEIYPVLNNLGIPIYLLLNQEKNTLESLESFAERILDKEQIDEHYFDENGQSKIPYFQDHFSKEIVTFIEQNPANSNHHDLKIIHEVTSDFLSSPNKPDIEPGFVVSLENDRVITDNRHVYFGFCKEYKKQPKSKKETNRLNNHLGFAMKFGNTLVYSNKRAINEDISKPIAVLRNFKSYTSLKKFKYIWFLDDNLKKRVRQHLLIHALYDKGLLCFFEVKHRKNKNLILSAIPHLVQGNLLKYPKPRVFLHSTYVDFLHLEFNQKLIFTGINKDFSLEDSLIPENKEDYYLELYSHNHNVRTQINEDTQPNLFDFEPFKLMNLDSISNNDICNHVFEKVTFTVNEDIEVETIAEPTNDSGMDFEKFYYTDSFGREQFVILKKPAT